jgi:hypothetical protein
MCTQYLHHIHLPTPFPHLLLSPTGTNPPPLAGFCKISDYVNSQKNWAEDTEIPHIALAHTHALPIISISHYRGTFATFHKPTLIHNYHSESTVHIKIHFECFTSSGLHKCIMTCVHPIILYTKHNFTVLKSSVHHLFILLSLETPGNHRCFYSFQTFFFFRV